MPEITFGAKNTIFVLYCGRARNRENRATKINTCVENKIKFAYCSDCWIKAAPALSANLSQSVERVRATTSGPEVNGRSPNCKSGALKLQNLSVL